MGLRFSGFSALALAQVIALLTGCGGTQSPIGVPPNSSAVAGLTAAKTPQSITYSVLHSFHFRVKGVNRNDGRHPAAGLINLNGTLYGTTYFGGSSRCGYSLHSGCGTVFAITASGTESVLYRFKGGGNGLNPSSSLIDLDGTLFGTTEHGGADKFGTVFSITPSGTQTVLHNFAGTPTDGADPSTALIDVKGTLYGTTNSGGTDDDGTVFSIAASGAESVVYNFAGKPTDGSGPSGLVNVHGTLYGTTGSGGANGYGTVFSLTTSGAERVLYSFKGGTTDGALPLGPLAYLHGKLYGTTLGGGAKGYGTVFSITTSGNETVIHSFKGRPTDGGMPRDGLINANGTLYSVTEFGGTNHFGTIFSITPSGTVSILHSFTGSPSDGTFPEGALLYVNGTLYGTTWQGGSYKFGTVFALTP
jgi:uncharacterized repeat protein (TIGR03803 family)